MGVESERAPTLAAALEAGEPVDVEADGLAADSLGVRRVGEFAFEISRRYVNRVVLVDDEAIREAQRALRVVAEPGDVIILAALISGRYRPQDERIVVLVCGGNADLTQVV